MDIDVLGHGEIHKFAAEMLSRQDVMRGDDAVLHDFLFVIDIVQEKIQCRDALNEPTLEKFPFLCWNDSRHEVERKNPLGAARIAIDVECYALTQKCEVNGIALGVKIIFSQAVEGRVELLVMAQNAPVAAKHF